MDTYAKGAVGKFIDYVLECSATLQVEGDSKRFARVNSERLRWRVRIGGKPYYGDKALDMSR